MLLRLGLSRLWGGEDENIYKSPSFSTENIYNLFIIIFNEKNNHSRAEAERMRMKASAYKQYGDAAILALVLEALPQVILLI